MLNQICTLTAKPRAILSFEIRSLSEGVPCTGTCKRMGFATNVFCSYPLVVKHKYLIIILLRVLNFTLIILNI